MIPRLLAACRFVRNLYDNADRRRHIAQCEKREVFWQTAVAPAPPAIPDLQERLAQWFVAYWATDLDEAQAGKFAHCLEEIRGLPEAFR